MKQKTKKVSESEDIVLIDDDDDVDDDEISAPGPLSKKKHVTSDTSEDDEYPPIIKKSKSNKYDSVNLIPSGRPLRVSRLRPRMKNGCDNIFSGFEIDKSREKAQIDEALKRSITSNKYMNNEEMEEIIQSPPRETLLTDTDPFPDVNKTAELFKYNNDNIIVRMEDYLCLSQNEYLSDVDIDFYLQYIYHEKMSPERREKIHIFPAHFYSLYSTSAEFSGWKNEENAGLSALEKRYMRVDGILGDVNIFAKDYLVIPLMDNKHWFLAIVCYPSLNGSCTYDGRRIEGEISRRNMKKGDDENNQPPLKSSCVLIFDSISGNLGRRNVAMTHIKNFLMSEWTKKYSATIQFVKQKLSGHSPLVPLQSNSFDCGCFLLEYFERFFVSSPVTNLRLPLDLKKWFKASTVRKHKRREIADVFANMITDSQIELPNIKFYEDSRVIEVTSDENIDSNVHDEFNNNSVHCVNSNEQLESQYVNTDMEIENDDFMKENDPLELESATSIDDAKTEVDEDVIMKSQKSQKLSFSSLRLPSHETSIILSD